MPSAALPSSRRIAPRSGSSPPGRRTACWVDKCFVREKSKGLTVKAPTAIILTRVDIGYAWNFSFSYFKKEAKFGILPEEEEKTKEGEMLRVGGGIRGENATLYFYPRLLSREGDGN